MQLLLKINPPHPVSLPLGYHHILQAIVYNLMGEGEENLHDGGMSYGARVYKMFTFGELKGHYSINGGRITFDDAIYWEIRALDKNIIHKISENLSKGIEFGRTIVTDIRTEVCDRHIETHDIEIKMASPICVRQTDALTGEEYYYNPSEIEFFRAAEDNFVRRFAAFAGEYPGDKIILSKIKVESRDRIISKYKGSFIEGYGGKYRLIGRPEYLDFLYQTGLGSRNSQGFGMFDVID